MIFLRSSFGFFRTSLDDAIVFFDVPEGVFLSLTHSIHGVVDYNSDTTASTFRSLSSNGDNICNLIDIQSRFIFLIKPKLHGRILITVLIILSFYIHLHHFLLFNFFFIIFIFISNFFPSWVDILVFSILFCFDI